MDSILLLGARNVAVNYMVRTGPWNVTRTVELASANKMLAAEHVTDALLGKYCTLSYV